MFEWLRNKFRRKRCVRVTVNSNGGKSYTAVVKSRLKEVKSDD